MAIDPSGKWWKGSEPGDVRAYLEAFAKGGYEVHAFRLAVCSCASESFRLEADRDEGVARRLCVSCGDACFIGDSEENWEEASPEHWTCIECPSETANVGVGLSLYEDATSIKWLYLGVRCASCGILGCLAEWKVGHDDFSLLDRV